MFYKAQGTRIKNQGTRIKTYSLLISLSNEFIKTGFTAWSLCLVPRRLYNS